MPGSINATGGAEEDLVRATKPDKCAYPGDVVVAGMSGRLPKCSNLQQFSDKLYSKVDLISPTDERFPARTINLPAEMGVINDAGKFDAGMFDFTREMAKASDPKMRLLLEATYESISDAGETMESLKGSRTGVYIGTLGFDYVETLTRERLTKTSFYGNNMAYLSQWISYFYDLKGPSVVLDSACSSSSMAMTQAILNIRRGHIDAAIVGGATLITDPLASKVIDLSGAMSPDSRSKSFDASANGYARSEGIMVFYVTKKHLAKRLYATILNVRGNADGFKPLSMAAPSRDAQVKLMSDVLDTVGIDRSKVTLAEAHGTGTPAGDGPEADGIAMVLCTQPRDQPLLISSVKSCCGHTEGAAGLTSMCKVIFSMENELIPPNLHFKSPNPAIQCLQDGRANVVAEATPWKGDQLVATVSAFGIGGSNYIACLRSNIEKRRPPHPASKKPRLICYCARSEVAAKRVLEEMKKHAESVDYQTLLELSSNMPVKKMPYRMFTILNSETQTEEIRKCEEKRPLWLVFGGNGCHFLGMGKDLMQLDLFRETIKKCSDVLQANYKLDLYTLILEGSKFIMEDPTGTATYCAIVAIQIGLVELLRAIGVESDGIMGHCMGELVASYADGCQTLEECMRMGYWRGMAYTTGACPPGKLVIIDLTWDEACQQCPEGIYPACHNGWKNVTIGGPPEAMDKFCKDLEKKGVSCKELETYGFAYHTPLVEPAIAVYNKNLLQHWVGKKHSPKFLSTSYLEGEPDADESQYSKLSYYNKGTVKPVRFYESLQKLPQNAILLEVNPTAIFGNIIKRSMGPECTHIALQSSKSRNGLEFFYEALGKLYTQGVDLCPVKLFEPVKFPVSRGTPLVSATVSYAWDHSETWYIPNPHGERMRRARSDVTQYEVDIECESDEFVKEHVVNGRTVYPEACYLYLLWCELYKMTTNQFDKQMLRVGNVKFFKEIIVPEPAFLNIGVCIMKGSGGKGSFEITENGQLVVSGVIFGTDGASVQLLTKPNFQETDDEDFVVSKNEIYTEYRFKGYNYGPFFQGIQGCNIDYTSANLKWSGQWVSFIQSLLQCQALLQGVKPYQRPTEIEGLSIDPTSHPAAGKEQTVVCRSDQHLGVTVAGGAVLKGVKFAWCDALASQDITSETTEFYKLKEEVRVPLPADLKEYTSACLKYSIHSYKKLLRLDKSGILPNKAVIEKVIASSGTGSQADLGKYASDPACGFARYLMSMFALPFDKSFMEKASALLETEKEDLRRDKILSAVVSPENVFPALDICFENLPQKKLHILELGALHSHLFPDVLKHCASLSRDVEYTAADDAEDGNGTSKAGVTYVKWNLNSNILPQHKERFDVILLKDSLYKMPNLSEALTDVTKLLAPGGFLIVQETTMHFPFAVALGSLKEKVEAVEDKRENGQYLSRPGWASIFTKNGFEVLLQHSDEMMATTFVLRKSAHVNPSSIKFVNISNLDGSWVQEVHNAYKQLCSKKDDDARLWLYSNGKVNGAAGFIRSFIAETCKQNDQVRGILHTVSSDKEQGPDLTTSSIQFKHIARMDLKFTELKDGAIGYQVQKPYPLDRATLQAPLKRAYLTMDSFGDMNTFTFAQRISTSSAKGQWASVYYSALNFHDMTVATGQQDVQTAPDMEGMDPAMIGTEFVARDSTGKRIMGYAPKAIATEVNLDEAQYITIPDKLRMRDAATIFMAYSVAYYALVVKAKIKKGEKILIHSGTTCVSQAAIRIALSRGLTVYTTVGSDAKRAILKEIFPEIPDANISSRETAFNVYMKATKYQGVDITLNCLAGQDKDDGQKLLRAGGRYVELKKFNPRGALTKGMRVLASNVSFISVDIEQVFTKPRLAHDRQATLKLLQEGLQSGVVQPIKATEFEPTTVKEAFELFNDRNHTGKILIKFREEESNVKAVASPIEVKGMPRVRCDQDKCYLLINGLEPLGLEVADWLVKRGARKLVLTGRNSMYRGYQQHKVHTWEKIGVSVVVSTVPCVSEQDTRTVVDTARQLGQLDGVFHVATVGADQPLTDMTSDKAKATLNSLESGVLHLDKLTRKLCGDSLRWFVAFTSTVQGSTPAGQTLQGFADSVAETLCEQRRADKLHGLALQRRRKFSPAGSKASAEAYWRLEQLEGALLSSAAIIVP